MRDDHAPGSSASRHLHRDTSWNKQPVQARKEIADKAVLALHVIPRSAAPTVSCTMSVTCPLPARFSLTVPGHGQKEWVNYYGCNFNQMHLTMTDVLCDPTKKVDRIEFRSVATETFLGIAGVTLLEAAPTGK